MPEIPTRTEADAAIAAEMQARELRESDRKAAMKAVPAFKEWEVDHGNRKTILRRVAPPVSLPIEESLSDEVPLFDQSEISNLKLSIIHLTAVVYDYTLTEITWRDEDRREWTILSNIDFRYLENIRPFHSEGHLWIPRISLHEVQSNEEIETASRLAERGFPVRARTTDHWLSLVPGDFLASPEPEYLIIAEDEKAAIPPALYEELDALHRHYHAHEERLIAEYERNQVMNEARRAWHETNPPEPKDTVINFWRVR